MRDRQRASPRSSHTASPRTLRKCKPRNGSSFAVRQPAPRVFFAKSLPSPVENLPGPGGWTDQQLPDGTVVRSRRAAGDRMGVAGHHALRFTACSFFWAVPKVPSWYTEAPAGEKLNASNGSASIASR